MVLSLSTIKIPNCQQLKCLKLFLKMFKNFLKGIFKLQTKCFTNKKKGLNSISFFYMQFLVVLKAIYFLDQKYGLALIGEPWVIQKSNKAVGTCILSLKIMKTIYS